VQETLSDPDTETVLQPVQVVGQGTQAPEITVKPELQVLQTGVLLSQGSLQATQLAIAGQALHVVEPQGA
jgi:hypothetical protein